MQVIYHARVGLAMGCSAAFAVQNCAEIYSQPQYIGHSQTFEFYKHMLLLLRLTIVSREAKKKQAILLNKPPLKLSLSYQGLSTL